MSSAFIAKGQINDNNQLKVSGHVVDAKTGKPLTYATILLQNSSKSNVTNSEGYFTFILPDQSFVKDSLYISYIGYKTKAVSIEEIADSKKSIIKIEPSTYSINAAYIRPEDAATIFKMAFNRINVNYSQKANGITGFYREFIKRGSQYVSLNEAILDIYKAPYDIDSEDQTAIYKGRGNQNYKISDTLIMKLQGGPLSNLYIDIMKNPFVGCDIMMAQEMYNFKFVTPLYKDGKNIIVINFDQKQDLNKILFRGSIYIDSETLAVLKIEFWMNVENNKTAWRQFVRHKPDNVKIGVESAHYVVNYKQYKNLWRFDYSKIELKFNAKYSGKWLKNKYTVISELAATNINTINFAKIDSKRRVRPKDLMTSKVQDFTDENFWEGYNIIEPDESIENIITKIIRQLKKHSNN